MEESKDLFAKCFSYDAPQKVKATGLYPFFRPIEGSIGSTVISHGKKRVMIGSNNYLGFTHHPKVIEAATKAIRELGTGCTGSRLLNGNLQLHEELEGRLQEYLGKEGVVIFATGFLSNLGALQTLVGRKDVHYSDRENHASILEGTRTALGTTLKFRHNDMADLERILKNTREKYEGALIVADGVFSMSGDILNLPEVHRLAKKYNCRLYVDDAHALGVLGPKGQGTGHHFNMPDAPDVVMATFSKSFASIGGMVAGPKEVINFLKHSCRPFVFSAAMPPGAVATVLECLNLIESEPEHLQNLWRNVRKMKRELTRMGFNTLNTQTPIIPLLIGEDQDAYMLAHKLYENGVFATPVVSPAVPEGCSLIRTSYMATHTDEELDYVLEVLQKLGREFGILENSERKERLEGLARTHFGAEPVQML